MGMTHGRKLGHAARAVSGYAESMVQTVREPLVVLNADLRVLSANRSFYETYRVPPEETENKLLYELGDRQWDIPKLREWLEEILAKNSQFQDFEVEREFPRIGRRTMLLNARRIVQKDHRAPLILLAIEDITKRKRAEEQFRRLVEAAPNGIVIVDHEGKMVLANAQMERLFGYSREELIAQPVEILVPERFRSQHAGYRAGFFADPRARAVGAGRDLFGRRKDG